LAGERLSHGGLASGDIHQSFTYSERKNAKKRNYKQVFSGHVRTAGISAIKKTHYLKITRNHKRHHLFTKGKQVKALCPYLFVFVKKAIFFTIL